MHHRFGNFHCIQIASKDEWRVWTNDHTEKQNERGGAERLHELTEIESSSNYGWWEDREGGRDKEEKAHLNESTVKNGL